MSSATRFTCGLTALAALALLLWTRDLHWMSNWEDAAPALAAVPLLWWLGRPWSLRAEPQRFPIVAAVISAGIAAYLAGVAVVTMQLDVSLWYGTVAPVAGLAVALVSPRGRPWTLAILLRYVEVLVWAVRYHAAFVILGLPIAAETSLAFACAGVIATMIPFVGNGLGVREWGTGLLAPILAGVPKRCSQPATSANASSIEMRSTSGVKSPRIPIAASPSRRYWSK